jgi:hypothetical protein
VGNATSNTRAPLEIGNTPFKFIKLQIFILNKKGLDLHTNSTLNPQESKIYAYNISG